MPDDASPPVTKGPRLGGGGLDDDVEAWIDELTWHGVDQNNLLDASMTMQQPASGVQYINGGSLEDMDMGGNHYRNLQQTGGDAENDHGQQPMGGVKTR